MGFFSRAFGRNPTTAPRIVNAASTSFFGPASANARQVVETYIGLWLACSIAQMHAIASALCKYPGTKITHSTNKSAHTGEVRATQVGGSPPFDKPEDWAFDKLIQLPAGGFIAPPGATFRMEKPHGIVYRRKTYNRATHWHGKTRVGYFDEAIRQAYSMEEMGAFADVLAQFVGNAVAEEIAATARAQGMQATII
jgi:hypothetical protein